MLDIFNKIYGHWVGGRVSNTQLIAALKAEYVALGHEARRLAPKIARGDAAAKMRLEWVIDRQAAIIEALEDAGERNV
jgi:hypothetical protein